MKPKKISDDASLLRKGGFDPPNVAKRDKCYPTYILMPKLFCLFALLSCVFAVGKGKASKCPAGYTCLQGQKDECTQGFYSLEGETNCKMCPEGKKF